MNKTFSTANDSFEYYLDFIRQFGWKTEVGTKKISNVGFTIQAPTKNEIKTPERKWSKEYAEAEWQWKTATVRLTQIMVGNGNASIKLIMLYQSSRQIHIAVEQR